MEPPADIRRRREVIDADEGLRARERHYMLRTQDVLARAFATDLGMDVEALEPRMAAAATITVFELLGRDVEPGDQQRALEALDRALVFIGGGIGALQRLGRGEAQDQLGGRQRHVELRPVADPVELDPVRLREHRAVALGGARPRQQAVRGAPDDPQRAGDPLGVERPAVAAGVRR